MLPPVSRLKMDIQIGRGRLTDGWMDGWMDGWIYGG
jgi:hypothetical protein